MGVRHERGIVDVINPPNNPYLHYWPTYDTQGNLTRRVVPGLEGLKIGFGKVAPQRGKDFYIDDDPTIGHIAIDFLPPIATEPPQNIAARELVQTTLEAHQEHIVAAVSQLPPDYDAMTLMHGNMWALVPEEEISDMLRRKGFVVQQGSFPKTGGRKRLMEHAIVFERT